MIPKYGKTVKGKNLSVVNGVFRANGEVLISEPIKNPKPNFANCDSPPMSDPNALAAYLEKHGEESIASGLHTFRLRLDARGLGIDGVAALVKVAIASPYSQITVAADIGSVTGLPDDIKRHVNVFELHTTNADAVLRSGLGGKSKVVAPAAYADLPRVVEAMFKYRQMGVRTVEVEPAGPAGLDWWLRYAERLVHSLKGGHSLRYCSFDAVAGTVSDMFYRIDRHKDGGEPWEHYADSPEQFDAAFWAYSELHQHMPAIERERRSLS